MHGFKDLLNKCTYCIKGKITLDNIFIFDSGLGIYFDGLEFGSECEDTKEAFRKYEGKCMKNYSELLLSIIFAKQPELGKEAIFEHLRKIVDPVLYYIVWFMHDERGKRKRAQLTGILMS